MANTARRPRLPRIKGAGSLVLTAILTAGLLAGCASGAANEAERDEARDAGLPEQLARDQATRTALRYFPPTGTPGPLQPAPPALEELVVTFGFRPDGSPDGSYDSVPAGVGTVYAGAHVSGVVEGQVIGAMVTDGWGNELAYPKVTIGPGAADLWLALPIPLSDQVPPGEYGIFIMDGDQVMGSVVFGVTGVGSSAQLLPEAPANPQVRATLPPPGAAPAPTAAAQGTWPAENGQGVEGQENQEQVIVEQSQ